MNILRKLMLRYVKWYEGLTPFETISLYLYLIILGSIWAIYVWGF